MRRIVIFGLAVVAITITGIGLWLQRSDTEMQREAVSVPVDTTMVFTRSADEFLAHLANARSARMEVCTGRDEFVGRKWGS